jgi:4-amino-4-deoxy-L-arabinose transferase-like glycosyltransferase
VSTAVLFPEAERSAAARGRSFVAGRFRAITRMPAVPLAAVLAVAAVLRLVALGRTPIDPFYAGAVRSMGLSWHNFLVGAYDPSARLAIDKAPVDLWLQVASTKVFGFTPTAMLLPAALGGVAAVAALYDLLNTLAGRRVALAGGLALAILPISVLTARSDTMDSVMAALVVTAFAVAARAAWRGRTRGMVLAGALLGLAFEAKLFEALIAAPPLAALWWFGAPGTRAERARALAGAAVACALVGIAWLVAITLLVPAAERPWAFGSTNGSAWDSTFVYDGLDRLTGSPPVDAARGLASRVPATPGPLRLLSSQVDLDVRIGVELAVAWVALLAATLAGAFRGLDRLARAGLAALALWMTLGTVLFSAQRDLRPRYLESFAPAIAACAALGLVLGAAAVRRRTDGRVAPRLQRGLAVALVGALLTVPVAASMGVVAHHAQDSGTPGALPAARLAALSGYLRGSQDGARYEAAFFPVAEAGGVIAHDARPVVMLSALGHPLVGLGGLERLIAGGQVRTVVVGETRTPTARWVRAHGVDVTAAAGQPGVGKVYAF